MSYDHSHHGHDHGGASERRLLISLTILFAFTVVEGVGGWYANSIALLAEAAHMLADSASLLLAVVAIRAGRRPPSARHTFGSVRYQTLAAYTNGITLLALTAWVMVEAVRRLLAPPAVDGELMLIVALLGAVANLGAFVALSGASSLNERSARAHVLSDLLGSGAATGAAILILALGWVIADPILSLFVSLLILRSGWALTREAGHVLLQGTPSTLDLAAIEAELCGLPGVEGIHHLHAWSLTGEEPVLTLHAGIAIDHDQAEVLQAIHLKLREGFDVTHATVQVETAGCAPASGGDGCHRAEGGS
jgi:cation diffusion facilitator family transporter